MKRKRITRSAKPAKRAEQHALDQVAVEAFAKLASEAGFVVRFGDVGAGEE